MYGWYTSFQFIHEMIIQNINCYDSKQKIYILFQVNRHSWLVHTQAEFYISPHLSLTEWIHHFYAQSQVNLYLPCFSENIKFHTFDQNPFWYQNWTNQGQKKKSSDKHHPQSLITKYLILEQQKFSNFLLPETEHGNMKQICVSITVPLWGVSHHKK